MSGVDLQQPLYNISALLQAIPLAWVFDSCSVSVFATKTSGVQHGIQGVSSSLWATSTWPTCFLFGVLVSISSCIGLLVKILTTGMGLRGGMALRTLASLHILFSWKRRSMRMIRAA